MMDRRSLFCAVAGAALAWPLPARAQQSAKVPRIGWLAPVLDPASPQRVAFWQGMGELGWVEGRNIVVEYRSVEGRFERFPELAAEFVRLEVDLIFAAVTAAARAAKAATASIPIVCFGLADPIGEGLIASLAHPGGNVTGFANIGPELVPKCLSILKEAIPKASRIAALWQAGGMSEQATADMLQKAEAAARTLKIDFLPVEARGAEDLDSAFATMASAGADAVLMLPAGALAFVERRRIIAFADRYQLPSMHIFREYAEAGGLMSYGSNLADSWRRGATYVDKILKGAKPSDLPVQLPTRYELVVNLKTAMALGLVIPPTLLAQADEVIE